MKAADFGSDFTWGVSTSAYQVEGAHNADGKGSSIWDVFSNTSRKVYQNHNGNTATDFYNRFKEDIALLKTLNIRHFRFSISWSRLLPNGTGAVNQNGIFFYHQLLDECIANGITPWVTLYHWDLPNELEKKGGWANREVIHWFREYVTLCVKHFGSKIKHWMILNEPIVFTGAGYFLGIHAPGRTGLKNFLPAIHHASLCQQIGFNIIKEKYPDSEVGTTFSFSHVEPYNGSLRNIAATRRVDAVINRLAIEPTLGLSYPHTDLNLLKAMHKYMQEQDEHHLKTSFDFVGVQVYTREIVKHSWFIPYIKARLISAEKRKVERTTMNWEIHPPSLYEIIKKVAGYSGVKKIIVTENGAAFNDLPSGEGVHDPYRVSYLKDHIAELKKAKDEGINITGYFIWSFTDNFEWSEGYYPRFGIVYVDFKTQQRIVKDSGYWYRDFLERG
ncbi:MAG: broad-specificity cellobiase [Bacteroidetes bacterium]|nr:broad-specificity cellobiase [Bacteroidota bacterium]